MSSGASRKARWKREMGRFRRRSGASFERGGGLEWSGGGLEREREGAAVRASTGTTACVSPGMYNEAAA